MSIGEERVGPPVARREPKVEELHGVRRIDDYAWMHDDVDGLLDYLTAERRYYESRSAHSSDLRHTLYDEMARRLAPTDQSVSWPHSQWLYYTRTSSDSQYADFCRQDGPVGVEQVVLSENDLAAGHDFFALGLREPSPDDRLLAYSMDVTGDEVYELRIRDLATGEDLPDRIGRSYYGFAWSADSTQFLYTVHDDAYRPDRVMRHRLGTSLADDVLVLHEPDERFEVSVAATRSGELVRIEARSRETIEVWLVPTEDLSAAPRVVEPRRTGIEYAVDHLPGADGGDLVIVTNDEAEEFRVVTTPVASPGRSEWVDLHRGGPDERLLTADAFRGHVVVRLRRDGRPAVRIIDIVSGTVRDVAADDPADAISPAYDDTEHEPVRDPFDTDSITVVTESLIDPPIWWSVNLATGERSPRKTQPVPHYDPASYSTARLTATAADGALIPVTIARPPGSGGPAPVLLYGYGAYEACIDPWFDELTTVLLDHGVGFAVAHVRGGGERGRAWWLQGRLHRKPNTFDDFVAAANMLAGLDWVDETRIVSRGLSAGGLLQGAVFSRAPGRWRAVVAEVPFVDVVTTMLDPSAPLTVTEWDEWGDPRDPDDYAVMSGYSPYENLPEGNRPDLLVTGSLHDPRVMVREPAKWVARLRATQTDDSMLLFRPELGAAAHTGASGRLDRLRYEAEIASFILTAVGNDPR